MDDQSGHVIAWSVRGREEDRRGRVIFTGGTQEELVEALNAAGWDGKARSLRWRGRLKRVPEMVVAVTEDGDLFFCSPPKSAKRIAGESEDLLGRLLEAKREEVDAVIGGAFDPVDMDTEADAASPEEASEPMPEPIQEDTHEDLHEDLVDEPADDDFDLEDVLEPIALRGMPSPLSSERETLRSLGGPMPPAAGEPMAVSQALIMSSLMVGSDDRLISYYEGAIEGGQGPSEGQESGVEGDGVPMNYRARVAILDALENDWSTRDELAASIVESMGLDERRARAYLDRALKRLMKKGIVTQRRHERTTYYGAISGAANHPH